MNTRWANIPIRVMCWEEERFIIREYGYLGINNRFCEHGTTKYDENSRTRIPLQDPKLVMFRKVIFTFDDMIKKHEWHADFLKFSQTLEGSQTDQNIGSI